MSGFTWIPREFEEGLARCEACGLVKKFQRRDFLQQMHDNVVSQLGPDPAAVSGKHFLDELRLQLAAHWENDPDFAKLAATRGEVDASWDVAEAVFVLMVRKGILKGPFFK